MSLVEACLDAEAKNIALRQRLSQMSGESSDAPKDKVNEETEGTLRAIELMKTDVGQAPWETTGFGTCEYRDPFPTGLSKRTPTGGYFAG